MALPFVPSTGVAPADLFEDLTRDLVEQYTAAETRILAELQRRIDRQLTAPEPRERLLEQLQQIRTARASTEAAAARLQIDPELADRLVRTAVAEGAAAAADRLGLVRVLPAPGPLTSTAASATVQVALDLRSSLDDVKQRILRYEADAYQSLVAGHLPGVLLGTEGSLDAQRAAVAHWLSDGIPAFVDKGGRQWAVGSYVEMATRTGLARAYGEASMYRQQQAGLDLVTVVVGASACSGCARAIGKVLTLGGDTGDVVLPDAMTGQPTTVHVDGTLSSYRAGSHLFGPNCRCIVVAYQPGLSIPAGATTYDPVKEKARDRQRALERSLRADKRKLALSPTEAEQHELRTRIRDTQQTLRQHIAEHDLPRKAYREQPHFADGRPTSPHVPTSTPPEAPPAGSHAPAPGSTPPVPAPPAAPEPPAAPVSFRDEHAASSAADVAAAAAARLGFPVTGFDALSRDGVHDAVSSVVEMLDAFPGVKMTGLAAELTPSTVYAFVETPTDSVVSNGALRRLYKTPRMVLSRHYVASPTQIARDISEDVAHGHFHALPDGQTPWQYVVAHEFGHALDANLQNELTNVFRREQQAALRALPGKLTDKKRRDWEKANLSGYGRGNAGEGVAEAFADVYLNGPEAKPFSRVIYDEAVRLYGEELAP